MLPPVKLPILTSYGARYTCMSSIASRDTELVRVEEPGMLEVPVCPPFEALKPMASLFTAPSMVTLLYLKLVPPKELSLELWGTNLVMSVRLRLVVGIEDICSRPIFTPVP